MIFIDTNIAIALRDVDMDMHARIAELAGPPVIAMMTRIELENGVHRKPGQSTHRRALLDRLLRTLPVVMFNDADIRSYQAIVAELGFDRRLTIDRLIAAQALTRDATLITHNGKDFRKISGLRLVEWGTPAA